MSRLVAFGCSHTAGTGLSDLAEGDYYGVSKLSWPYRCGAYLDIPAVNMARAGADNAHIANRIRMFEFDPDDTVVVMWTHYQRVCQLTPDGHFTKTLNIPNDFSVKSREAIYYTEYYAEYDAQLRTSLIIFAADAMIKKHTNRVIHVAAFRHKTTENFLPVDAPDLFPIYNNINFPLLYFPVHDHEYEHCPDGHLGALGNDEFGWKLASYISAMT